MISEKHLVPGRALLRLTSKHVPNWDSRGRHLVDKWIDVWQPCMVVAYYPDIKRRHSRSTAPVGGWEVLIIWLGPTPRPVEHVRIPVDHNDWKPAPF